MLALLPLAWPTVHYICNNTALHHQSITPPSSCTGTLLHCAAYAYHHCTLAGCTVPLQEEAEVAWDLHHAGARTRKRASETKSAFFCRAPAAAGRRDKGGRESAGEVVSAVSPPFSATFRPSSFLFFFPHPTQRKQPRRSTS